jgi:hypothetical protein
MLGHETEPDCPAGMKPERSSPLQGLRKILAGRRIGPICQKRRIRLVMGVIYASLEPIWTACPQILGNEDGTPSQAALYRLLIASEIFQINRLPSDAFGRWW